MRDLLAAAQAKAVAGEAEQLSLTALKAHWRPRLSWQEIEALIISKRTLARRKAKGERLSADETDRAFRVARVMDEADRVFGDGDKAARWLRWENPRLSGKTALSLLGSEAGAELIEEMLVQLEHGIYV